MKIPEAAREEKIVVGCMSQDKAATGQAIEILDEKSFVSKRNRMIFLACKALFEESKEINITTVMEKLSQIRADVPTDYFLDCVEMGISSAMVESEAMAVRSKQTCREIYSIAKELEQQSLNPSMDTEQILSIAEDKIFKIAKENERSDFTQIGKAAPEVLAELEKIHENGGQLFGITTGLSDLNYWTRGLQGGKLYIIAARPSQGKSALMLSMAHKQGKGKIPVGIFSLEMPCKEFASRLLSMDTPFNSHDAMTGKLEEHVWQKMGHSMNRLYHYPIFVDDTAGLTLNQIRSRARRGVLQFGFQVIYIDYLQLMKTTSPYNNKNIELGEITSGLKSLSKELDIPIVLLSQLSRRVEERPDKKPRLSDLRDSGAIEQDADTVIFIWRPEVYEFTTVKLRDREGVEHPYNTENLACLLMEKQRSGPAPKTIKSIFLKERTEFCNYDSIHEPPQPTNLF